MKNIHKIGKELFITSDEEIKEGDYFIRYLDGKVYKSPMDKEIFGSLNKIILTTDQDLIKDGVQAIDDEFLEWFVKNPSCESVEITEYLDGGFFYGYKIIIPKEEAKKDLEKEMFELEQELNIPSHLRWHNSKPKQKCCKDISDFELGTTCPKCNKPFRSVINEPKQETLEEAIKPLMKWLCENTHPHTTVIVRNNSAELFEGIKSIQTNEFLID